MNKAEIKQKVKDLLIVRENDGSYNLFGKYYIMPKDGIYFVYVTNNSDSTVFSSLRHAVTWCVFEKNNKEKDVKRIAELDDQIASLDAIITQYKRLIERAKDYDSRHIYMAKLFEEKLKKQKALKEINDYALTSKYWQSKKYAENKG